MTIHFEANLRRSGSSFILGCTGNRAVRVALAVESPERVTCRKCIKSMAAAGVGPAQPVPVAQP